MDTGTLLILLLPFLLSLAGQGADAKAICLTASVVATLLSVEQFGAVLPWSLGMLIALTSVWERIRQRGTV